MQSPTIPEIRKETERTVIRFRALLSWITTEPSLDTDQDVGDRTATRISDSCSHAANAMAVFTMVSNPVGVLVDIVYPSISGLGLWHATDGYWSVTLLGWSCPRVAEGTLWSLGAARCAALRPERSINDPWASAQSDSGMTLRPDAIRMVHSGLGRALGVPTTCSHRARWRYARCSDPAPSCARQRLSAPDP